MIAWRWSTGVEEVGRLRPASRLDWTNPSTASRGSATVLRPPSCPLGPVMAQLWQLIGPALKLSIMPPYSFDQACNVGPSRMLSATA